MSALWLLLAVFYPWLRVADPQQELGARIAPPAGYEREPVAAESFAEWLRHLPLKPGRPPVYLHDGPLKADQTVTLPSSTSTWVGEISSSAQTP